MSRLPAISVVIPTYNHASFVLHTFKSVFAQTFSDIEVIVVNDGSPDRTHELLMPLAEAGKIRYFRQQNAGQAAARNRGIEAAMGRYIALIDDDDLWPTGKLMSQMAVLEQDPSVALVYGRADLVGEEGESLSQHERAGLPFELPPDGPSGDVFRAFLSQNFILSPGQTLIRRAALDRLGEPPFDEALWGVDDYDLYLRLSKVGGFVFQKEFALQYRVHSANASRNEAQMHLNEKALFQKLRKRAKNNKEEQRAIIEAWKRRRGRLSRYWAATTLRAIQSGKFQDAATRVNTLWRLR